MPHKLNDFALTICILIAFGAVSPVTAAMLSKEKESRSTTFARMIRSVIFMMSPLIIYHFKPDTSPWVLVGAGAVLSSIGQENTVAFAKRFIKKRLGEGEDK